MIKFDEKESISGVQQLKSSVQKGIRARLLELYPHLESYIDQVLPKKDTFRIVKCHDHIEIMAPTQISVLLADAASGQGRDTFVLSGANIMCPGLTSPGARMSHVDKGQVVAVMAEGKENALAIGMTSLSTDDM
ncbi:hypothetical protein ACJJTC_014505 [Scirpophaga incertulas]